MLNNKLLITREEEGILTTFLENGKATELRFERTENTSILGNIYIGKVKNVVKNIQAAFIEIEKGKECYYSIGDNPSPIYTKKMNSDRLVAGDELLVQISRESSKTKVPTVTSCLNFTGKYLVLTWGKCGIGVSGKIPAEHKERLRLVLNPMKNKEFGFIVRTNAMQASETEILKEAEELAAECLKLTEQARYRTCFSLMKGSSSSHISSLRDAYTGELSEILIEDEELYQEARLFLLKYQPEDLSLLRKYEDSLLPLSKLYNVEGTLQEALRPKVWLKSGAYLVIQPTEALTVVDVNTGKYDGKKKNQQDTFLKINLEAAKEIARQLRLRNISGIVIIDFINMEQEENKVKLMEYLDTCLKRDPVKTALIDMTPLHLVELTRKKVRRPLYEQVRGMKGEQRD